MSPSTITLLFLAFAIVSFILEKIPLGLTATIVAIGLNLTGVLSNSDTFVGALGSNLNTMVVGLGGYKFKDYVKAGLPLIAVSFVICIVLLPILFPFYG